MTATAEIAGLEAVRANQPVLDEDLAELERLVPGEIAQPVAIAAFQRAADRAGVALSALTFADPQPVVPEVALADGRILSSLSATMTVDGGYFQTVDLLRRVQEDGPRAVMVDTLSIAPSRRSGAGPGARARAGP
jgi:hypothetical protein